MSFQPTPVNNALDWLRANADPAVLESMGTRYGIHTKRALGVPMNKMKALGKQLGTDHDLAAELWSTGWYEARMVASMVDDPEAVTSEQMDSWVEEFDNWAIVDTVCFNLFDRTRHGWDKVDQWAERREALRAIGKRRRGLRSAALEVAERLAASDHPAVRKIGRPAVRELAGRDATN
jgi:3-methyladenine DNA glycosylase AlkD